MRAVVLGTMMALLLTLAAVVTPAQGPAQAVGVAVCEGAPSGAMATLKGVVYGLQADGSVKPLPQATVSPHWGGPCTAYDVRTDADGAWTVKVPTGAPMTFEYGCQSATVDGTPADCPTDQSWASEYDQAPGGAGYDVAPGSTTSFTFTLEHWVTITGRLVDAHGRPVTSGIAIEAAPGGEGFKNPTVTGPSATGVYTVTRMTPGNAFLQIYDSTGAYRYEPVQRTVAAPPNRTTTFNATLAPYVGFTGAVMRADGRPVPGRTLSADLSCCSNKNVTGWAQHYQWYRDGHAVPGATGSTYRVAPADDGHTIRVSQHFDVTGYRPTTVTSIGYRVGREFKRHPLPRLRSTGYVGTVARAVPGRWRPRGVHFRYQWYREGAGQSPVAIKGAHQQAYRVRRADDHASISVEVTASKRGYATWARFANSWQSICRGSPTRGCR
jgi:hypothetical protein